MRCVVKDKAEPVVSLSSEPAAHLSFGEQVVRDDFVNAIGFKQVGDVGLYCCIGRAIDQFSPIALTVDRSRPGWWGRRPGLCLPSRALRLNGGAKRGLGKARNPLPGRRRLRGTRSSSAIPCVVTLRSGPVPMDRTAIRVLTHNLLPALPAGSSHRGDHCFSWDPLTIRL
jgi:hypothetical protein